MLDKSSPLASEGEDGITTLSRVNKQTLSEEFLHVEVLDPILYQLFLLLLMEENFF